MAVHTITIPGADEQLVIACNKRARASGNLLLDQGQKFACVLVKLAPAVTPADYPALKAAIEAVAGVQGINLLVDGQAMAELPGGKQMRLYLEAATRIENVPEEEPPG